MTIYKTVYETFNPEKHIKQPQPYKMYWKQSFGWVASEDAATRYTEDEHVTRELNKAAEKCNDTDVLNVAE